MSDLPLIVLDIDGVLANFEGASVQHFGPCDRSLYGLNERYPDLLKSEIDAFVNDPLVYAKLSPIPGAVTACSRLMKAGSRLAYVTARPGTAYDVTQAWLALYGFPVGPLFVYHWEDKAAFIADLSPVFAVDDSPRVINGLRELNVFTLIFDQPWNAGVRGLRISGWEGLTYA